jgi:PAS domain S-box-containing protein
VIGITVALFVVLFPFLHQTFGWISVTFSWGFIVLAVWFWGLRGGVLAAVLGYLLNVVLLKNIGAELLGSPIGPIFSVLVAALLGRLRDLSLGLRIQLSKREEIEDALRNAQDVLELRVAERTADLEAANEQLQQEVAERKQTEELLGESEAKYRELVQHANSVILRFDTQGRITFFNEFAQRFFDYTEDEILHHHLVGKIVPPTESSGRDLKAMIEDIIRNPARYVHNENETIRRNGERAWIAWTNKAILGQDGCISEILSIGMDITDRKQAEKALREGEEKIARLQKMESLGLLAGGVAHDLNNVLSGIVSYPELLLLDLPEDSRLRKPIETMEKSGHRAVAIVEDLLTVARGVATKKEPLNLNDIIREYLQSPEFHKFKEYHPAVTIRTNLDNDLLNVAGSLVHIRKVAMNLVSNASEAIEGSGNVAISTVNRYADKPLKGYDNVKTGEYAVLAVSDDGSGISSEDLERIFEPFYTKKVIGRSGTGLGLAVVWNVVQDHQGYIDVQSTANGTTFEIYFPITREAITDWDLSMPIGDYKGAGETILVVDDVNTQREIACNMLNTLGYKTKAVSSGEEAVKYLQEHTVDLILLDMIMDPGISGRETYERVIKIHPNQKAVIVSGFAETDEVREAQSLGAGHFIKKPFTLEKIGFALKDELEK